MMRAGALAAAVFAATPALADYGAIAFSPVSGAYGYGFDFVTRAEAEGAAMQECRAGGADCRVVAWFQNACGVLVTSPDNGWGASWGNTLGEAESRAFDECYSAGNASCQTVIGMCSYN